MSKADPRKAERYTPPEYVGLIKDVFPKNKIWLDPASCAAANQVVQAERYFTKEDDGLSQEWNAYTLFLNPPYNNMLDWVEKLLEEIHLENTKEAILLANVDPSTRWFRKISRVTFIDPLFCFPEKRIRFYSPLVDTPTNKESGSERPSMFVYFGENEKQFRNVFEKVGALMRLT